MGKYNLGLIYSTMLLAASGILLLFGEILDAIYFAVVSVFLRLVFDV